MGNSQGVQLRSSSSPFTPLGENRGFGARKLAKERRRWSGGATKFASPENRVLPPPVAGQRLRMTDNGHILLSGGTISGRKLALLAQERERRNESFEDGDYSNDLNESSDTTGPDTPGANSQMLYGHRKSHSDPDIVHSMIRNDIGGDSDRNPSKSIIAVSPSKAKIKSRKKSRAPEPPLCNTLPRDLDKIPMFCHYRKSGRSKSKIEPMPVKSKSPAPPPPPPPPNEPSASDLQSAVYEKKKRGQTKSKTSKSSSDIRNQETNEEPILISLTRPSLGRMDFHRKSYGDLETKNTPLTAIFDSRNSYNQKLAEHVKKKPEPSNAKDRKPNLNKSFQEEIMAAVKKKSGLLERNLCIDSSAVASPTIFGNCQSDQVKAAWSEEMRKRQEKKCEPDYEDAEEPISYSLNEIRYKTNQTGWNNEIKPSESRVKSRRFQINEPTRNSQIDVRIVPKSDWIEKPSKTDRDDYNLVNTIGLTEKELKRHTEQQQDPNLIKSGENGKWIMKNTREKLQSSKKESHQGLWANNKHSDLEHRDSLAKEIYLEQEQKKRSRNLNQIENNLYTEKVEKNARNERASSNTESEYSSSSESMKDDYEIGALMRPTLPRKNLQIPQFSPTQAWKNLVIDQPQPSYFSDLSSDECEVVEERIRHSQIPVAPRRSTIERCTDSGISPDAGSPLPNNDRREIPLTHQTRKPGVGRTASPQHSPRYPTSNWIPQQDLLDDSDLGSVEHFQQEESGAKNQHYWTDTSLEHVTRTKQSFPYGIFSGRQPTEVDGTYQLKIKPVDNQKNVEKKKKKGSNGGQHFNSLRSLKKVLGLKLKVAEEPSNLDTNWSLSRSTPAINNELEKPLVIRHSPSENMLNSRGREAVDERFVSETLDDYNNEEPEIRAVKPQIELIKENKITKMKKKNKFSYQNTIRREEKKKMEEKLNHEVARRELQREKEIQWMNKVEEEFRKRRDREKINIRYQLKMLNDEDPSFEWDGAEIGERESRSLPYIPSHSPIPPVQRVTNSPPIQKQVKNGAETFDINDSVEFQTSSSTTASSPDIPQWPQSTGMSKWLRKKKSQKPTNTKSKQKRLNSIAANAPRPEPEGGRSSGDEHRSLEAVANNGILNGANRLNDDKKNTFAGNIAKFQDTAFQNVNEGYSVDSDCFENFIQSVEKQVNSKAKKQSRGRNLAKFVENNNDKVPKEQLDSLKVDCSRSELINKLKKKDCPMEDPDGIFARGHPHRSGGRAKLAPNISSCHQPVHNPKKIPCGPIKLESKGNAASGPRHISQQDFSKSLETR